MPAKRSRRRQARRGAQLRDAASAAGPSVTGLRWRMAVVVIAGLVTYAGSLQHPFLFDDFGTIVRNQEIRGLWSSLFQPRDAVLVGRPLASLSLAINYAINGLDVAGYHVVNIAVHLACALLMFGLARRTLIRAGLAADAGANLALAASLIWTVHPINSEVVEYITERTESMMAFCYLATLYASARGFTAAETEPGRGRGWLALAVVACAAGMLCKEPMISAPLMVAIYDRVFLFDSIGAMWRARRGFYAALASTWIIIGGFLIFHGQTISSGYGSANLSPWSYLLNQTVVLTHYLRLVVWPAGLVLYYGWPQPVTLGAVLPQAVFMTALFVVTVIALVKWPRIGFAGVWAFIILAPSSSFVPIGAEVGAERRMYLPLVALLVLAVVAVWKASSRLRPAGLVLLAVVMPALAVTTMVRTQEYASSLTMAETILSRWPSPNAHQLLGTELAAAGRRDEAIQHLQAAVGGFPPAGYFLGAELVKAGRLAEGITALQNFVAVEPNLPFVRSARLLMGRSHAMAQQFPEAIEQFQRVLQDSPADAAVHGLLADAYAAEQHFDEALPHYRAFLQGRPEDANGWTNFGVALVATGKHDEALGAFRRAVDINPANGQFRVNLARALLDRGDLDAAFAEAQRAVAAATNEAAAHEILARTFAARGAIDDARREYARALQIDPSYAPAIAGLRQLTGRR